VPDEPRRIVERGYDWIADRYAEAAEHGRGGATYFRRFLDGVLERIPDGGRVVDLGCGAGLVAAELAARSRVVGVDRSRRQLELARTHAPTVSLVRGDIAEIDFVPHAFDAVCAFWSLIHVPRDLHGRVFARIHGWLRPGGLFAGTLGSGDNPDERQEDFFGAPMYWSHHDAPTNRRMVRESGFELLQADEIEDEGETSLWVLASAQQLGGGAGSLR
jgi:SAM-dependent methyltransferase